MAHAKKSRREDDDELPSEPGLLREVAYDPRSETRLRPSRPGDYLPVNVDAYVFQRAAQEIAALGTVPPGLRAARTACLAFVKSLPGERRFVQSKAQFMRQFMDLCRTVVARLESRSTAERRAATSAFLSKHPEARDLYESLVTLSAPVQPDKATELLITCFAIAYLTVRPEGRHARVPAGVTALLRTRPVPSPRELGLKLLKALGFTTREADQLYSSLRSDETRARKKKSRANKTSEKRRRDTPP